MSYLFDSNAFADTLSGNYPFDPSAVKLALFFVLEENAAGDDIYDAVGLMPLPVPEPSMIALWLVGTAILLVAGLRRRRLSSARRP